MQPDANPGWNGQLLTCNHANQGKNALTCCVTLWMSLQAVGLLASTTAVALTNRVWTYFKPRCWAIWNAWVPCCETIIPSEADIVLITPWTMHVVNAFTCFPTCKCLGRIEYCCLLLSTNSCSGNQKDKLQENRESPNFKTGLENDITHEPHPAS